MWSISVITKEMFAGIVNISKLCYSSDTSNRKPYKPPGTTIKPEECVPESKYSKQQKGVPACESGYNASCPAECNEMCKPNNDQRQSSEKGSGTGKNGKYQFRYWHLLTALIVTGVAIYKVICQCFYPKLLIFNDLFSFPISVSFFFSGNI